jgi:hypothetical protein
MGVLPGASRFEDLLPDSRVAGMEVHDFNGDGAPDLSFAHAGIAIAQLSQYLLLNDGLGHFSPMPGADMDESLSIIPFYVDYDADGDLDIVGYMPEVDEVTPGNYVGGGYEIAILENTSNVVTMDPFRGISTCPAPFRFNDGLAGAWYNPETPGQGVLIKVEPEDQFLFLAWFTHTDGESSNTGEQHWFTAQGNYSGQKAELTLYETLGGKFDDPQSINTNPVGTATLNFSDCGFGMMSYNLSNWHLEGVFPLERAIPGSENVCKGKAIEITTKSIDINAGMDGAWYNPETPGQGLVIDVYTDSEGENFIFVAWFTFGDDTSSGQQWLTAQGSFGGSTAQADVYRTTGGSFDDPQAVSYELVGTLNLDFTDCSNASLSYSLTEEGSFDIIRALPKGKALCESLSSQE